MSKKMLINALHAEEARVAIVEDGRLVDLDVEIAGNEQIRGNIYKGVVVRVEPGLQAAFVDIGLKKLGFLQMGELHPENWKWRDDVPEDQRHRRPRIQEVLRRGQELIVQVEKGERDNKGSALTSYASLPGRYMVLMPGSDSAGISRKVEAEGERKKLKEIISEMTIPEGYGYIIRTEAMGRSREELQKDLDSLIALYEGIRSQGAAMKGAGLIYQESALIIRTIRDYFSADIDEVLVDSKDVYKDVRECLKEIDPQFEKLVKMHQEKRPIFSRYQLEEQIDLIYEKKVPLKSGGSIFIEPTEALVSIDVNSGKSTGEKGVEDTAFKTNMEAAEEAARQLRLRDLGGLIVIDFIDMRDRKHNAEVEKTLKSALKADKARVNVSRISEFGLLEMSRQRIRQTLNQASSLECPHCDGRGKVKSVEAMALSFLRKVHAAAAKGTIAEVIGSLPLEVAYYLLNRKRHELSQIEGDYDIEVTVKGKPSYLLNQMDLELVRREKLPQEELPQEKTQARTAPVVKEEAHAQEPAAAEGRKKRKKGKAKPSVEAEGAAVAVAPEAVPIALVVEPEGAERVITVEGEQEEQKKKRRRKRKRGGKGISAEAAAAGEHVAGEPVEVAVDVPAGAYAAEPAAVSHPQGIEHAGEESAEHVGEQSAEHAEVAEEAKKKRRRKRRRGGKGTHEGHLHEGHLHEGHLHEGGAEAAAHHSGAVVSQEATMFTDQRPVDAATFEVSSVEAATTLQAAPANDAATPAPVDSAAAEGKAKRGRRPRAAKPAAAAAEPALAVAEPVVAEAPAGEVTVNAEVVETAKTRRAARVARPAKAVRAIEAAGTAETAEPVALSNVVAVADAVVVDASESGGAAAVSKPKGDRAAMGAKAPKGAKAPRAAKAPKGAAAETADSTVVVEAVATEVGGAAPAAPKKRGRKPKAQQVGEPAPSAVPAETPEPAEAKPKKTRAPRKKKEETPA
jgi:ribonuclease E